VTDKKSTIQATLEKPINLKAIEQMLPARYRPHVERFIRRAGLTFATSKNREKLAKCSQKSIVQAVCAAAEYGFALDDKFVYAIPYLNTVKDPESGKDVRQMEVQATFDYKALVAVARRNGLILDLRAQEVCENDEFEYADQDFKQTYCFRKARGDRGGIVGAYAIVTFPSNLHRFEHMDISELRKVRAASKSKTSPAWTNWEARMYVKAVVKRALTWVQDDPTLGELISYDNQDYDLEKSLVTGNSRPLDELDDEILADAETVESEKVDRIEQQNEAQDFRPMTDEEIEHQIAIKRELSME